MIESFTVDSQPRPTPVTERGLRLMTMAEDAKRRNLSAKVMTTALVVSLVAGTVGIDVAASRLSSEGAHTDRSAPASAVTSARPRAVSGLS